MTAQTVAATSTERTYLICRCKNGSHRVVRGRKTRDAVPAGWTLVETLTGRYETAQARAGELNAAHARSVENANKIIRSVINPRFQEGKTFRVTEEDLKAKGLVGVLQTRARLTPAQVKYLKWVEAGRPAL